MKYLEFMKLIETNIVEDMQSNFSRRISKTMFKGFLSNLMVGIVEGQFKNPKYKKYWDNDDIETRLRWLDEANHMYAFDENLKSSAEAMGYKISSKLLGQGWEP